MRLLFVLIGSILSSAVIGADIPHAHNKLNEYLATEYWLTDRETKSAEFYTSIDPEVFLGRARSQIINGNFSRAIANLDIYLSSGNSNSIALLLRGQAKMLSEPPAIDGACADFLVAAYHGFDISVVSGIESFCEQQPGWSGR